MRLLPHRSQASRSAIRIFSFAFGLYLALCFYLYVRQTYFIFIPQRQVESTPKDFGCDFAETDLSSDGSKLQAWKLPAQSATPEPRFALLYLHGNYGSIGANAEHACRLSRMGFDVFIFDYRGYGNSEGGPPTEKAVYEDAEAAWQMVMKNAAPSKTIIYGHSLGGAVAVELASKHPEAAGLITESAFTSVYDVARRDATYAIMPLRLLITERLDSLSKVDRIKMPKLFMHGDADQVVPADMAKSLYDRAPEPKQLVIIPGGGHDNSAVTAPQLYRAAIHDFTQALDRRGAEAKPD